MATNEQQLHWLTQSVGLFLTDDRVVHVHGEDSVSWLNGQVTADVRTLAENSATYALTVSLKGRVHSDLWAVRCADGPALVLPAACQEAALASFEKHIIMEDVELVPDASVRVLTLQGPAAARLADALAAQGFHYACARVPPLAGVDVWVPEAQLAEAVALYRREAEALGGGVLDEAGWSYAHVVLGVPRAGIDFGADSYPQEAGLKGRSVSFSKGCYTGQEVVYMLEKRGQLARRLVQLRGPRTLLARGALVSDPEGQRAGEVTSAALDATYGYALAYVKRGQAHVGTTVRAAGGEWQVTCIVGENAAGCPIVASA